MKKTNALNFHNIRPVVGKISLRLIIPLIVCLAIISPAQAEVRQASTDFSSVDSYIESQMKDLHIVGAAVAIVQSDQVAYMRGYGDSGRNKRPATPQTPFMLGSMTKSFTALAIMQLVEAGRVELDAPVQTYLPWFRVADPLASAQITVRHLLNQDSGFSQGSGLQEQMASDLSDTAIEDGVRRLADDQLSHAPGTTWQYSNVNFNILGQIIQTVTGKSYETYIQEHIFSPLEMHHSFTSQDGAIQDGMAKGHTIWFGIPLPKEVPFNRGGLPNGYLISSVEDMGHYLIAELNGGRYGDANVLSAQGVAAMHQPAVPTMTSGEYYGMAWSIGEIDGVPAMWHSGDNANFASYMLMVPDQKVGIVVLLNTQGLFMVTGASQISRGMLAIVTGKQPQPYDFPMEGLVLQLGSVGVPVVIAVLWMSWMLFRFLRRQKHGLPAHRSAWWYILVIAFPLVIDLGLMWVLLLGIPKLWGAPLSVMAGFFPELFTFLITSAVALAVWGLVRTILTLRAAKSQAAL